ncbi:MAG: Na+/H+ antiporter NhaA [Myxococcales bacterium]|nr:Na+/H+ antiporter NhaA [Myxococcales bacterium]
MTRRRAFNLLLEFSIPLIAGVLAALAWANLAPHSYHQLVHGSPFGEGSHLNLHFAVNDVFMALFFGIAAKEITESALPGGALNPPRKAINPLLGTLGGVLGPITVYFIYVAVTGDQTIKNGWGIPTATDIAIAWLVARIAFGAGHPAVSFLLLLAVADDGIGLGIIAVFYPDPAHPVQPIYLLLVAAAVIGAYALRRRQVNSYWAYLLGPGVLSWFGLFSAHLHPALALVPVVPFMPHADRDEGLFAEDQDHNHYSDTLNAFEHAFKVPVDLGLFVFGLANAGVVMSNVGSATTAVLLSLLIGKTVGIFLFSTVGHALGFSLPEGMTPRSLLLVGVTASLGLTVALFVAGVAFTEPSLQGAAKMGALMSVVAAPIVVVLARLLRIKETKPEPPTSVYPDPAPAE